MAVRNHRIAGDLRLPTFRAPTGGRNAIAESTAHHEDEIDRRDHDEGLPHADRGIALESVHQHVGQWCSDHRTTAEAHDCHARRHAATVREPLDQGRDRGDVTEPEADTSDDARTDPHQPELVEDDTDSSEDNPTAPAAGRDEARLAGASALKPAAPYGRRAAEKHEKQGIHPAEIADAPVAAGREERRGQGHIRTGDRRRNSDRLCEWQPKHREAIGHTDAEMNGKCRRRHQPAIEARLCDDALAVE